MRRIFVLILIFVLTSMINAQVNYSVDVTGLVYDNVAQTYKINPSSDHPYWVGNSGAGTGQYYCVMCTINLPPNYQVSKDDRIKLSLQNNGQNSWYADFIPNNIDNTLQAEYGAISLMQSNGTGDYNEITLTPTQGNIISNSIRIGVNKIYGIDDFNSCTAYLYGSTTVQYTVSLSSNPSNGGTTSGANTYNSGSSVTVTATPNSGFTFANWTESGSVVSV